MLFHIISTATAVGATTAHWGEIYPHQLLSSSLSLSLPPSVAANHAYVPSAVMIVFSLDQQCHILPYPPSPHPHKLEYIV